MKLLASIPPMYETVYVVCDTYIEGSIKTSERVICRMKSCQNIEVAKRRAIGDGKKFRIFDQVTPLNQAHKWFSLPVVW